MASTWPNNTISITITFSVTMCTRLPQCANIDAFYIFKVNIYTSALGCHALQTPSLAAIVNNDFQGNFKHLPTLYLFFQRRKEIMKQSLLLGLMKSLLAISLENNDKNERAEKLEAYRTSQMISVQILAIICCVNYKISMMVIVIKNIQLPNGYYMWKYCDTYLCHKLDTTSQSVVRNTNSIS